MGKNDNKSKKNNLVKKAFNGYRDIKNFSAKKKQDDKVIKDVLEKSKQKIKKETAKRVIRTGLNSVAPGTGEVADRVLKTEKGEELLDEYLKADSPTKGLMNVAKKIKNEQKKKLFISFFIGIGIFFFFLLIVVSVFLKNADSQIYSNENNGKIDTEQYPDNDLINPNVFVKYPGIYQKIETAATKVGNKYKVDIDKYLILATLIAPIENGNIVPISDNSCGEVDCYYLEGKSYTWEEFLSLWGDQAEYLAKSQILTYINPSSSIKASCGEEDTMEQYAKNDLEVNEFNFWAIFNPVNWFKGFRSVTDAELNAKCIMDVPVGESSIPTVYVLSKEQGIYYTSINANHERTYVKDPNTGGVYFWNLVNNGGFIHVYMKDYLSINESYTDDQNYELNLSTILDTANYIYSYYESIRKDCNGFGLIESTIETINVRNPNTGAIQEVDFEEQYIGGVLLAEYSSGDLESLKAFSILARSYAISVVGKDGKGVIENSSNNQNYNSEYSKDKYPKIAEAVEATKGLVVTKYGSISVLSTEYDAFCPTRNTLKNGFYYLPDGQNNLPINPDAYAQKTGKTFTIADRYLECPCFQNVNSRPADTLFNGDRVRFTTSPNSAPTSAAGNPSQTTLASCWTYKGYTRTNWLGQTEYGWSYSPTGGHGRGASQYGLKYYEAFEYEWEALIKLFYGDISIRRLSSSLEEGECQNASFVEGGNSTTIDSCGVTFDVTDSNYTKRISGNPLNEPLTEALNNNGYSIDCLNGCISQRVVAAGIGTRQGVVEAAVGLLECTMEMTGGYTYPYDHRGGWIGSDYNSDITNKLGVNSRWGEYHERATGCQGSKCRLGLNCANFVRWSMCNGGMDLCDKGSTYATGMAGVNERKDEDYFPGAIRVFITGNSFYTEPNLTIGELSSEYKNEFGSIYSDSTQLSSINIDKILALVKPGDVLYSDVNGGSNHVMVIVGTEDSAIWIAENGRKTRVITYDELKSGKKNYVILLLDDFYSNSQNRNSLSW